MTKSIPFAKCSNDMTRAEISDGDAEIPHSEGVDGRTASRLSNYLPVPGAAVQTTTLTLTASTPLMRGMAWANVSLISGDQV